MSTAVANSYYFRLKYKINVRQLCLIIIIIISLFLIIKTFSKTIRKCNICFIKYTNFKNVRKMLIFVFIFGIIADIIYCFTFVKKLTVHCTFLLPY